MAWRIEPSRAARARAREQFRRAGRALQRLPYPPVVLDVVARLRVRPGLRTVSLANLLLGDENGVPAADFARAVGDLARPSTPIGRWPHALLLHEFAGADPARLDDGTLAATPYAANARQIVAATGDYFGARTDEEILRLARHFLARAAGAADAEQRPGANRKGRPVRVRPVRDSACHQVIDGHHRLALAHHAGTQAAEVAVEWRAVHTPLQLAFRAVSGRHAPQLDQPVDLPELAGWPVDRPCHAQLEDMLGFLARAGIPAAGATYLDVGARYGWFVAEMAALGFDATGIERHPLGAEVALAAYGLDRVRMQTGDLAARLHDRTGPVDVVSFFDRPSGAPPALAPLLAATAGTVLFVDDTAAWRGWVRDNPYAFARSDALPGRGGLLALVKRQVGRSTANL